MSCRTAANAITLVPSGFSVADAPVYIEASSVNGWLLVRHLLSKRDQSGND